MEMMTVTKLWLQFGLFISKFYNCTKFYYHQVVGEKVTNDQDFQVFSFWPPFKAFENNTIKYTI